MRRILIVLCLLTAAVMGPARAADYTTIANVRVAMDDGVLLAADVFVPTAPDADGDGLYPCVVELTPYRKEMRYTEGASLLPAKGIALIEVDARGTGGSAGEYDTVFSVREQADAAAWVEWAAMDATVNGAASGAKLCEATVGMYGGSYSGIIQNLVASLPPAREGDVPAAPPHLAAIAPQRAYGDLYRDIVYHGGMAIGSFGAAWTTAATALYLQPPSDVTTGDGSAAWLDHLTKNDSIALNLLGHPYADAMYTSDDSTPAYTQRMYEDSSALGRIENMRVPALHLAGFYDTFTRGQLLTFGAAHALEKAAAPGTRGPNFLIAGPWNHGGTHFITPEQGFSGHLVDWYRYWLESKANGSEAPEWITDGFAGAGARALYFDSTSGIVNGDAPLDGEWRTAETWPPPAAHPERLYLRPDGSLGEPDENLDLAWVSNPTAGLAETGSRWDNAVAGATPHTQLDQRLETGKGLTFSTGPLSQTLSIAGPINVQLSASVRGVGTDAPAEGTEGLLQLLPPYIDTDFVVKLSDVAPDGTATLVTQGYLRASHRAYDPDRSVFIDGELMAPFHLHTKAALEPPVDGEARSYQIEVWPTAKTFAAGHAIRLDITSADTPNHLTLLRPTFNTLHAGSYISLPVTD